MIGIIFTVIIVIFIGGFILGILNSIFERIFRMYGGFWGALWAYAINTLQFCIFCWLVSFVVPCIHWELGLTLGPLYCTYCLIFNKENKLLSWILG